VAAASTISKSRWWMIFALLKSKWAENAYREHFLPIGRNCDFLSGFAETPIPSCHDNGYSPAGGAVLASQLSVL
jgi:hypothetical protein